MPASIEGDSNLPQFDSKKLLPILGDTLDTQHQKTFDLTFSHAEIIITIQLVSTMTYFRRGPITSNYQQILEKFSVHVTFKMLCFQSSLQGAKANHSTTLVRVWQSKLATNYSP